ncbi:MAG: glycoside hydrolase family 172 protein [Janthinobacterium lividum]
MSGPLSSIDLLRPGLRTKRISSYDRTGGNFDAVRLEAGETKIIADIQGAGIIKHIWITHLWEDPMIRRNAILRMFWDGEEYPSVEVPLGDFFGQGWAENYVYASLPLAAAPADGRGLNCYFPMPFGAGARIEIENQSDLPLSYFFFYIDYEEHPRGLEGDRGRFHAWWNRQMPGPQTGQGDREDQGGSWTGLGEPANPSDRNNYLILDAKGAGQYVGVNYFLDAPSPIWYGEGDDMFLIDGEAWPGSLHGTGTEDYFNTAFCPKEVYAHPYFGCARINDAGGVPHLYPGTGYLGRTHVYRFHLEDPIYFEKSLRASIEHGHANALTMDIATVAYWYQAEPHAPFPALPPREKRQPMPPIDSSDIHRWRDAWRREQGGGALWGTEDR